MAPRCFLAFFILTSCLVAGQSPKYALTGGKVSLKPVIAGLPDSILWKHKGNKVVEFNGNEQHEYSPFKKRVTLAWLSAELQITDLRFEDSGEYELEVDMNKGLHRSLHKLEVMDTVAEPTISCEMNGGSSSNSSAVLQCSSESRRPQSLTKFEWSTRGKVQPGPKLTISLGDEHDDEVYSCSVRNPLSSETATFTAKDCYPDKSSSVTLIASLVSIFAIVLLLGVGVGIWYCKRQHKACFAKGDLEKQSPPYTTEDKKKARRDINRALVERASTRPSNQPLCQFAPAVDMDKQEEEPLTGRSPACDMDKQDETPQKGHVDDTIRKLYGENYARRTPLKKLQTENHTDEHKRTASPPSPPPSESSSPLDQNNPASNDDSDADADQYGEPAEEEVQQYDRSDSEKANEPDPASVSDKLSEDAPSDLEFSMAPEPQACDVDEEYVTPQKGHVKDKTKLFGGQTSFKKIQTESHTDEHKRTASPPSPPPSESPSPLDQNNPASNDDSDADADQYREPAEEEVQQYDRSDSEKANEPDPAGVSDKLSEDAQSDLELSMAPEPPEPEKEADEEEKPATSETSPAVQPHSPATKSPPNMAPEDTDGEHEEDADSDQVTGGTAEKNVRQSDSSEKNESDVASEDKLFPSIPEQRGSKTSLHDINFSQEEAHTNKDNQQETVKPVSEDDDESDKELYLAASQQPQSPTPTKPDNGNADTPQESPHAAHANSDNREEEEEGKTSRDSDESDGQSDKGEGETDDGKNDIQLGLKEEKPGNESLSEDKEGQKEDEVVK